MLILLPNLLGDLDDWSGQLPAGVAEAVASLDGLIAEDAKQGRRYLKRFVLKKPIQEIPVESFRGDMSEDELLEPVRSGGCWGVVSDAGLPCIADPGARLVARAKALGIEVQAFPGPCSMMLALMLSGMPGQRWAFHGYLEKDEKRLAAQLRCLERRSQEEKATQLFMERPFKNAKLWRMLLETLGPQTRLAYACDLTLPSQEVQQRSVEQWRALPAPALQKRPAVFLIA